MGEVYLARDSRLGRRVALKLLRQDRSGDQHGRRLLHEARAASALNHPHIVTVYDVGSQDGIDYVAMEFVDGDSLADVLARSGPLTAERAVHYAVQVTDALMRAHEAGIVHRDLKPANVMIDRDDRAKVLDFGIAKLLGPGQSPAAELATTATSMTAAGMFVGTVAYMSPEQAQGRPVDARSDIFSFGVLLYELLTGRTPFQRDSAIATLSAILQDEPAPVEQSHGHVAADVLQIIARCLRKDPSRRFQTMADLHAALLDAQAQVSAAKAPPRKVRLRSLVIGVSCAVLLAVAAAIWLPRWTTGRSRSALGGFVLSRLTFEEGLQAQPVWSPDGRFLAYSADRDGNFDVFVHQVEGGTAVRVTTSPATDWQPDWSPDGNRLVFRSERDRGGLFVVAALGGREQRISPFGYRPRWSPDGRRVLFVSSTLAITARPNVYVVGADGADTPARILVDALRDFRSVWSVEWHPKRDAVTFLGRKGDRGWDLWVASPNDATAARFEIADAVKAQIVTVGSVAWASDGEAFYLEGTSPSGVTNIHVVPSAIDDLSRVGSPQMLTSGLQDSEIAVSKDGTRLAYTRRQERNRIWKLPLDAQPTGGLEHATPLTPDGLHALLSDVSADGSRLAFIGFRDGQTRQELWEIPLEEGKGRALLVDDFRRVALRWSRDGARLAYRRSSYDPTRTQGQHSIMMLAAGETEEDQVTSRAQNAFDIPYDWSKDGKWILGGTNRQTGRALIARYPIAARPAAEAKLEVLADSSDADLWQARYSSDDALLAFTRVPRSGVGESVIHTVRAGGSAWIPVTEPGRWADKPRWAPHGSTLYFISNRVTGAFNVWSQEIDPTTGRPVGNAVAVTRFDGPRVMINPLLASVELSLVPGAVVLPLQELSGNIWLMTRTPR